MIEPLLTAISVRAVSKSFRAPYIPKYMTLKEAIVKGRIFGWASETRRIDALTTISLDIPKGCTFGIIGRNGSGKSTLLRLISGVLAPDSGEIVIRGTLAPLLSLGTGFHPDLTGRENAKISGLILGMHPRDIERRLEDIASFAELEEVIDYPVRTYSTGMYMRLAFSVAVNVDPDILLLDEVFAVGDAAFSAKCRDRMESFRAAGKTIVFVSHDLESMRSFCDRAAWIDGGELRAIGEPADVIAAYQSNAMALV